jgi:hypothetical protein
VHILTLIDIKASLILLVGDRVSFHCTDHHLIAHHVIVHNIFQSWLKSLLINEVEVDQLVCCDLDPNVTSNEIDETSNVDRVVQNPLHHFVIIIVYLLEEQYFVGTPDAKSLVKEQLHLAQVFLNNALIPVVRQILWGDSVHLSLSIDGKYLIPLHAIKALVREVQHICVHNLGDGCVWISVPVHIIFRDSNHLSILDVPHEVVVRQRVVVEEGNKDFVHAYEAADDVWILEDVNGHCVIIESKQRVEINLFPLNL